MLRHLSQLAIALLLATGLTALALLSIQNVNPIALTFLAFRSIQLPVGLLLVLCVAGGIIVGSFFPLLGGGKRRSKVPSQRELDTDFDFDDLA
jgi:putative membrane protein